MGEAQYVKSRTQILIGTLSASEHRSRSASLALVGTRVRRRIPTRRPFHLTAQPDQLPRVRCRRWQASQDRKSTRLNSSHLVVSYAVFCLKKKTRRECGCHS